MPQMLADAGLAPADARAADEFYRRTVAAPIAGGPRHQLRRAGGRQDQPGQRGDRHALAARRPRSGRPRPGGGARRPDPPRGRPTSAEVQIEAPRRRRPGAVRPARSGAARRLGGHRARRPAGRACPCAAAAASRSSRRSPARGVPTVLSGFALPDDGIHGPNEHLRVEHLEIGTRAAMAIFAAIGELGR